MLRHQIDTTANTKQKGGKGESLSNINAISEETHAISREHGRM